MTKPKLQFISVTEAAKRLGKSTRRVREFCEDGRLGRKAGNAWVIDLAELECFEVRAVGRPRKLVKDAKP
jgi:hypothetical protein